ncbi:MAG: hypothetical protein R2699_00075 [Acidimicrobiales bacterium]
MRPRLRRHLRRPDARRHRCHDAVRAVDAARLTAGRALELDAIYRAPVEAAAAAGRPMVRTEALWRQLAFLDRRARGARGTR